jgi:hypothetical protein
MPGDKARAFAANLVDTRAVVVVSLGWYVGNDPANGG